MTQPIDEELDGIISEEESNDETSTVSDDNVETSTGENNRPTVRKNKSNFSKLAKKTRVLESKWNNPEALAQRLAELEEGDDFEEESSDEEPTESEVQMLRREMWYDKHPEALERMEAIETLMRKHSMSRDEALAFDKLKNPTSQTKKSFSSKSTTTGKKLEDMTEQEVLDSDNPKLITSYYRSKEKIK